MTHPATVAVLPLRDGAGKTRLAGTFDEHQREDLIARMARHVVDTVLEAGPVCHVVVVTADPAFTDRALPADQRLTVLTQSAEQRGLNAAVNLGYSHAASGGADRVLIIHADLPLLTTGDVRALLTPDAPIVLAPDRARQGTNALALGAAMGEFTFRFGPGSAAAHAQEADTLGLDYAVVARPGTSTDLDTCADWAALPPRLRRALSPANARGGPPRPPVYDAGSWPTLPAVPQVPGARR